MYLTCASRDDCQWGQQLKGVDVPRWNKCERRGKPSIRCALSALSAILLPTMHNQERMTWNDQELKALKIHPSFTSVLITPTKLTCISHTDLFPEFQASIPKVFIAWEDGLVQKMLVTHTMRTWVGFLVLWGGGKWWLNSSTWVVETGESLGLISQPCCLLSKF